jgi:hypothetical protein
MAHQAAANGLRPCLDVNPSHFVGLLLHLSAFYDAPLLVGNNGAPL